MNVTVSQLNAYVKQSLAMDAVLSDITVTGELSGVKLHSSGHIYFSLKDENALIRCAFFKPHSLNVKFRPADGMRVSARGRVTLFERDGQYQLNVFSLEQNGDGELFLKFERLKKQLESEGLFDSEYKKPLPKFIKKVGVATSPTGAVIRDIINVATRRCPDISIVLAPVAVQGPDCPRSVIAGIDALENIHDVDVIIVGRGGGSMEDLFGFNDETLARRIFACKKPVISAVGHETDFTIADFVADLRAPTPSAAAELAVFDSYELYQTLDILFSRATAAIAAKTEKFEGRIEMFSRFFSEPEKITADKANTIEKLNIRLENAIKLALSGTEHKITNLENKLNALNPLNVLERGYAVITDKNGKTLRDAAQTVKGDEIDIRLKKGKIHAEVKMTLEQTVKKLEETVAQLEKSDIEIDKAIELYEQGALLTKHSRELLDGYKKRITVLKKSAEGIVEVPMEEKADE